MLLQADAFRIPLPDKSVHSCVTSPPYWGLRKYAGEQGLEPLGLEPTPERHIERMVKIFREVRRVLRDDGVFWLNYGDCYGGSGGGHKDNTGQSGLGFESWEEERGVQSPKSMMSGNLMLMPHRLAIALQDDGWIVRNDLVWFKRNPMPESVAGWRWERSRKEKERHVGQSKQSAEYAGSWESPLSGGKDKVVWEYGDDYVLRRSSWRHTRAHEYVFQLVKGMGYYCNQEAVRENLNWPDAKDMPFGGQKRAGGDNDGSYSGKIYDASRLSGRNPRSVLDVPTAPYKGAHYATFPPNLIAPLIRASVPRRCCPECGQAWAPVVEKGEVIGIPGQGGEGYVLAKSQAAEGTNIKGRSDGWTPNHFRPSSVTDYRPTCEHDLEPIPGIVLDPFGGSGTTGMVAKQLLRRWVVLDISRPYLDEQAKIRTRSGMPSKGLEDLPLFEMGAGDSLKGEDPCD